MERKTMRSETVRSGITLFVLGVLIGGFGYADKEYYLTEIPIEFDEIMYYTGGVMVFIGFIVLVYGLLATKPTPPPPRPPTAYYPTPAPTYAPTPAPQPPVQPQVPRCPTCNQPLELIQQYNRWYCRTCQKYV